MDKRWRDRWKSEQGMTLVELVVAMGILSIVMVVFLSTLTTVQKASVKEDKLTRTDDQVRLAMQTIDRQVRSGNLLYNPSTAYGSPPLPANYTLLIYTQSNLPTVGPACVLWTIDDANRLLTRAWEPLTPENPIPPGAVGWRVVAENVVNRDGASPTNAFSLDPTGRTITVTFLVDSDPNGASSAVQRIQSSVTGRNTSFGYPVNVCQDAPADLTP